MRKLTLLALALIGSTAFAQSVYRWIDPATGKTMVTDTPPPGSVKQVGKTRATQPESTAPVSFAAQQAAAKYPVTLYTTPDCAEECKTARALLNKRGVPFSEKVLQTQADYDALKALIGNSFVPSIQVGSQTIKGFQAESYNNLLDLAGYPTSAPYGSKPSGTPQ